MITAIHLVADNIKQLTPYQPGKTIAEIQRAHGLRHVVKLASNENPLGPSPAVLSAIANAPFAVSQYPEDQAPQLRERLSQQLGVASHQITFGAG